jgi:uncharacterized protein (TIGR00255 family)
MIASMTAFARRQENTDFGTIQWEVRSVNQRFLDLNFRMPEVVRHLEMPLREIVRKTINRGKCDISLRITSDNSKTESLSINRAMIDTLVKTHAEVAEQAGNHDHLSSYQIMQWPGVMEEPETDEKARDQVLLSLFKDTMADLVTARQREGEAMKAVILERVEGIGTQLQLIKTAFPEIQQAQRDRILDRFNELSIEPDAERLEQELVFLAQKSDIAEEVDRLQTHMDEIRRIMNKGGQVGRRLDFLMQELNREANTIGSKSIGKETTAASVEMKVLIEQMREQIQNIE